MGTLVLLDAHLEQISQCAASIAELNFPKPQMFTNALLHNRDITSLIRDTELHERVLFTVPTAPDTSNRRQTVAGGKDNIYGGPGKAPRKNTAVAAVLGKDLVDRIRRGGGGGVGTSIGYRPGDRKDKGEVDVDVLLEGAEKLCNVYPMPGALERIAALRRRHFQLQSNLEHYEALAAEQAAQLSELNAQRGYDDDIYGNDEEAERTVAEPEREPAMTVEDLRNEEEEVRELECRKRTLEERVTDMEKDLGGHLR